eukprot:11774178-Karenia_brevis.AAC.1
MEVKDSIGFGGGVRAQKAGKTNGIFVFFDIWVQLAPKSPNIAPKWFKIAPRWLNIDPRWSKIVQNGSQ